MKRGAIREDLIYSKIVEIEESMNLVRANLPKGFEEFSSLGLVKDGIFKRVEYAIEDVFDICHILNSDMRLGIPSSESDVLHNLTSHKLLDSNLAEKLLLMRKFRNIVVHRYGKIDDQIAFSILSDHLADFGEFVDRIRELLKKF